MYLVIPFLKNILMDSWWDRAGRGGLVMARFSIFHCYIIEKEQFLKIGYDVI